MATKNYKDLKDQLAKLQEATEAARIAELEAVVADIRVKVAEYGITAEQIFGRQRSSKGKTVSTPVAAKYQNPKTGETWSGRGRAPAWIKDAKNRDRFLIV
ncbi:MULTISPECIES: H-NS histone family protein [Burkholderia cepacia complex]|uniref:H-NS histone family protein n=1 Tax=Burkholderia cepacia complex TaxID=87882 RepID=UPI002AB6EF42|nr:MULTISPECIES: H-NS histone family protein [Burkholderia cepacia complex]